MTQGLQEYVHIPKNPEESGSHLILLKLEVDKRYAGIVYYQGTML